MGDSVNVIQILQQKVKDRDNTIVTVEAEVKTLQEMYQAECTQHTDCKGLLADCQVKLTVSQEQSTA